MSDDTPVVDVDWLAADQIGIVVGDIEDGMDRFYGLLGVGPWNVYRFEPPTLTDRTYYGERGEYSMLLATAVGPGAMVELIQPLDGPSLYADHLREHGEGLHHVGTFLSEDVQPTVEKYEDAGISVIQSGSFGDVDFWYIDTAPRLNGVLVEIIANIGNAPSPDRIYEPER